MSELAVGDDQTGLSLLGKGIEGSVFGYLEDADPLWLVVDYPTIEDASVGVKQETISPNCPGLPFSDDQQVVDTEKNAHSMRHSLVL